MNTATPVRTIAARVTALGAAVGAAAVMALAGGHGSDSFDGLRMCPMGSATTIPVGTLSPCKSLQR